MRAPTVPFLAAVEDVSRGNTKIAQRDFLRVGLLPIVDQGASEIAGYTNDLAAAVASPPPLVVFGDHTRAVKFVDHPFAMGADGVKVLKCREGFHARYVYHYLKSQNLPNAGYSRHFKFLKEIQVPAPPIEEQRRIAAILDQADAIRTHRRQILTHLDALPAALFHSHFSGSSYPRRVISSVGRVITGKTPPTSDPSLFEGDVPFVTPGDLDSDAPAVRSVSERGAALSRTVGPGATLVCCIGATIGKAGQSSARVAFNQQINAIEWGPAVDTTYGYWATRALKPLIVARGASTTLPLLPKSKFSELLLPVPPLAQQREFGDAVAALLVPRTGLMRALARDDELFASLQARAFKGEL